MFEAIDTHGSSIVSIEQVQRSLEHLGPSFFLEAERLLDAGQMSKKMIDLPTFKVVIVPVLQRFLLAQEVDKLRARWRRLADTPHLPGERVGRERGKMERAHADREERQTDREAQDERASDSLGGRSEREGARGQRETNKRVSDGREGVREGDRRQKETNERGLESSEGGGGGSGGGGAGAGAGAGTGAGAGAGGGGGGGGGGGEASGVVGGFSPSRVYVEGHALKKHLAASACLEVVCSWAPVSPTRRQQESATRSTQEETPEPEHVFRRKGEDTCMSYEEEALKREHVARRKEETWERENLRKFGPFQSVSEQERTLQRGVEMAAVRLLGSERLSDDAAVFFRRSIALSSQVRVPLSSIYVNIFSKVFWWLSYFAAPLLSRGKGYKSEGARWLARGTEAMATLAHVEALRALEMEALSRLVGLAAEVSEQGTTQFSTVFSLGPGHHLVLFILLEPDSFQNFCKMPKTQNANVKITSLPPPQCPWTPWWRRWRQRGHWVWRRRRGRRGGGGSGRTFGWKRERRRRRGRRRRGSRRRRSEGGRTMRMCLRESGVNGGRNSNP
jgi:hypothetical protein